MLRLIVLLTAFLLAIPSHASEKVMVAVASNFEYTLQQLKQDFSQQHTDITIVISAAASGTHFQQIQHGAPFDIFLSADSHFPELLKDRGETITYAFGKLALASNKNIEINNLSHYTLAIANPKTAPYGLAASQFLASLNISHQGVIGHNVGQTLNYVTTGAVDGALVALAQKPLAPNLFWHEVDASAYQPIKQAAVLLKRSIAAELFWDYLQSPSAKAIIIANGYDIE
jgi:molybdate transport system substrate-binding protein